MSNPRPRRDFRIRAQDKARERGLKAGFLVNNVLRVDELGQQSDTVLDRGMFHHKRRFITASLVDGDYRTPFIDQGFKRNIFDLSIRVSEAEAVSVARQLTPVGVFGGLQTCAVIAAAWRLIECHQLRGDVVASSRR